MHWNYRVVKRADAEDEYELHVVYWEDDLPVMRTVNPIVTGESPKAIRKQLKHMLKDAKRQVLDDFEIHGKNEDILQNLQTSSK